mgnify:CR=1 FL=1
MKRFPVLIAVALVAVFVAVAYAVAPPDTIVINSIQKLKPPVPFNHKAHAARATSCQECHHKNKVGEEQKCSACHQGVNLKDAYHEQCKECHKKQGKGPTKCDGCHKK